MLLPIVDRMSNARTFMVARGWVICHALLTGDTVIYQIGYSRLLWRNCMILYFRVNHLEVVDFFYRDFDFVIIVRNENYDACSVVNVSFRVTITKSILFYSLLAIGC